MEKEKRAHTNSKLPLRDIVFLTASWNESFVIIIVIILGQ